MIFLRKINRFIAVFLLLAGLMASNPVIGMCVPMILDLFQDVHTESISTCCESKESDRSNDHQVSISTNNQGCGCCGCGLEQDESSVPVKQSTYALASLQSNDSLKSIKISDSCSFISTVPEHGNSSHLSVGNTVFIESPGLLTTSPTPLFIWHLALLN